MKSKKKYISALIMLIMTLSIIGSPFSIKASASKVAARSKFKASTTMKITKSPVKPKINVVGFSKMVYIGQTLKLKVNTNHKYSVQYRVLSTDSATKKITDLTKGYTKNVAPKVFQYFNIPAKKAGKATLSIYLKQYNGKANIAVWNQTYTVNIKKITVSIDQTKDVIYNKVSTTYGSKDIKKLENVKNSVKLTAKNITYQNAVVQKDLYIKADNIKLNNIRVNGTIYIDPGKNGVAALNRIAATSIKVLSGGVNSIHFTNVATGNLEIGTKESVRIVSGTNTVIKSTTVKSAAILENTSGSFGNVQINMQNNANLSVNNIVVLKGSFDKTIIVKSNATIKTDAYAEIADLDISPANASSKIMLDGNFKNVQINKESKVEVMSGSSISQELKINTRAELKVQQTAVIFNVLVQPENNETVTLFGNIGNVEVRKDTKLELGSDTTVRKIIVGANVSINADKTAKVEEHVKADENLNISVTGDGSDNVIIDHNKNSNPTPTVTPAPTATPVPPVPTTTPIPTQTIQPTPTPTVTSTPVVNPGTNPSTVVPVASIALEKSELRMQKGTSLKLAYLILPTTASNKVVSWSSSNTQIAEVNALTGDIIAKEAGKATITVTSADGSKKSVCEITVIDQLMLTNYTVNGSIVIFETVSSTTDIPVDVITVQIFDEATNNLVYPLQLNMVNGKCSFEAKLEKGSYKAIINGIYLGKEIIENIVVK